MDDMTTCLADLIADYASGKKISPEQSKGYIVITRLVRNNYVKAATVHRVCGNLKIVQRYRRGLPNGPAIIVDNITFLLKALGWSVLYLQHELECGITLAGLDTTFFMSSKKGDTRLDEHVEDFFENIHNITTMTKHPFEPLPHFVHSYRSHSLTTRSYW